MVIKYLLVLILSLLLPSTAAASDAPNVTLVSPADGNVTVLNNITFTCNVTDDENILRISLYHDINNTFGLYGTENIMELESDSSTKLLCKFNNEYVCDDGEMGVNSSTDFVSSKFMQGVRINESDTLKYLTSDNINYYQGTVEFWVRLGFDPSTTNKWLFSTGTSTQNEVQLYSDNGNMYFYFYDDYSYSKNVYKSVSGWNEGEWHHVAVVWDLLVGGGVLDMFLDGSNDSVTHSGSFYDYGTGSFNQYMYIGSYASGSYQANSTFDEFRVSNSARSRAEINASYTKGIYSYPSESASWTLTGVADGIYKWNCLAYDNESQNSWNDTNRTLYVDTSSPVTNSITLSSNSTNDVDPSMSVNVESNITDLINISYVILQWKETGDWNNDTMDYNTSTGIYENASITFDQTGGTYYYRTWSNDTLGHSNYSDTYNITAEWDYTWSMSPSDFGTVYGLVGCSGCYVGTLTINNTGDDVLSIQLTDDWPLSISYNVSNPFNIGPKNITIINVAADFSNEDSEYDVVINVTASHGSETPSPAYQIINVTLNSYSGGPYFDNDDITITSPSSIYQGMEYNLSARVKNIGNDTASDVWINWTLPSGWTNTSGNLTQYIGSLNGSGSGNEAFNNVTVYITPASVRTGVHNVYANVSSSDNLTGNASAVTYVICSNDDSVCGLGCTYLNDDDCASSSGGPGGSVPRGAFVHIEAGIGIDVRERTDINRGDSGNLIVSVNNPVVGTILRDITLHISGYPQTQMSISPVLIESLIYNQAGSFAIEFNVPEYMALGEYELTLNAAGTYSDQSPSSEALTMLFVHSATENETLRAIQEAEGKLQEMEDMGFVMDQADSLMAQARASVDGWDYDSADDLASMLTLIWETSISTNELMIDIENNIEKAESLGIEVPETKKMYSLAMAAFNRGDYDRAKERANSAMLTYSIETYGIVEVMDFMYDYWWVIVIMIAVIIPVSWKIRRIMVLRSVSGKLRGLEREEKGIFDMIRDYQKRYWQDKSISTEDYQESLSEHEKKMTEIMKNRSGLTVRKIKLNAKNVLQALEKELESIKRRMNELQNKYFYHKGVSKTSYLMMMNGLNTEMMNIQKSVDMMGSVSKKPKKSGKHTAALAITTAIILLLLALLPCVNALGEEESAMEAIQNAETEIQSMQELGFGTIHANDILNEAKLFYSQGHYLAAESLAEKVTEIKNLAIETDSMIDQVEAMLYESSSLEIDTSPAELLFNQSLETLEREDYTQAKSLLIQTMNKLDELESEAALQKTIQKTWYTELSSFLRANWVSTLIALVVVVLSVLHFSRKSRKVRKGLRGLEGEKRSLEEMLKDLQIRYFRDSLIGKSEYERLRKHYRKNLMDAEKRMKNH